MPFFQNVVWKLGFRPLSSKMWFKTWISNPFSFKIWSETQVLDPFLPKCGLKPRFQITFFQNVVRNLGFRPLSSKMWFEIWFHITFFQNIITDQYNGYGIYFFENFCVAIPLREVTCLCFPPYNYGSSVKTYINEIFFFRPYLSNTKNV